MSVRVRADGEVLVFDDLATILLPPVTPVIVRLAPEAPVSQTVAPNVVAMTKAPVGPTVIPSSWTPIATHGGSTVSQVFIVECTSAWTATCASTGMAVTGGSGAGTGSFTVTFTPSGSVATSAFDIVVTQTAGTLVQHITGSARSI